MTKEELAKKRGVKNTPSTKTAAESILTTPPITEESKEEKKPAKKATDSKAKASSSSPKKPASKEKKNEAKPKVEAISLDSIIKKTIKPASKGHTYYLSDVQFSKLEEAAKKQGVSSSKLLGAIIDNIL